MRHSPATHPPAASNSRDDFDQAVLDAHTGEGLPILARSRPPLEACDKENHRWSDVPASPIPMETRCELLSNHGTFFAVTEPKQVLDGSLAVLLKRGYSAGLNAAWLRQIVEWLEGLRGLGPVKRKTSLQDLRKT